MTAFTVLRYHYYFAEVSATSDQKRLGLAKQAALTYMSWPDVHLYTARKIYLIKEGSNYFFSSNLLPTYLYLQSLIDKYCTILWQNNLYIINTYISLFTDCVAHICKNLCPFW